MERFFQFEANSFDRRKSSQSFTSLTSPMYFRLVNFTWFKSPYLLLHFIKFVAVFIKFIQLSIEITKKCFN